MRNKYLESKKDRRTMVYCDSPSAQPVSRHPVIIYGGMRGNIVWQNGNEGVRVCATHKGVYLKSKVVAGKWHEKRVETILCVFQIFLLSIDISVSLNRIKIIHNQKLVAP